MNEKGREYKIKKSERNRKGVEEKSKMEEGKVRRAKLVNEFVALKGATRNIHKMLLCCAGILFFFFPTLLEVRLLILEPGILWFGFSIRLQL